MKQNYLRKALLAFFVSLVFVLASCGKSNSAKTKFAENKVNDAGSSLSYEQLVAAVGAAKANTIMNGAGSEFNRLTYALGTSNAITLVNQTTCAEHMVDLLSNLNAGRVVTLVNEIDDYADVARSANFVSSAAPTTLDTITRLSDLLNAIHTNNGGACAASTTDVNAKLTALIAAIAPGAGLDTTDNVFGTPTNAAGQIANIQKLAKTVAHLTDASYTNNLIPVINGLTGAQIVGRLGRVIAAIGDGDRLVEVVETTDAPAKLVRLIQEIDTDDVVAGNKLSTLISGVLNGTKLGYIITNSTTDASVFSNVAYDGNNTTGVDKLIYILNTLTWVAGPANDDIDRMTTLINDAESGDVWTGQINNPTWGVPTLEEPASADSTIPRLVTLINDITEPQDLVYILQNVSDYAILRYVITDVIDEADMVTLINNFSQDPAPVSSHPGLYDNALETLAGILNGLSAVAAAESWKLRIVVDGCRHTFNIAAPCAPANQAAYLGLLSDTLNNINEANAKSFDGPLAGAVDAGAGSNGKMVDLIRGDGADYALSDTSNRWYPEKLIDLIYSISDGQKLANVVNGVNPSTNPTPNETAVATLVYTVKNVTVSSKLVQVINGLTTSYAAEPNDAVIRLTFLVNELAEYESNLIAGDPTRIAGQKLAAAINDISDATDLAYVIDNVRTGDATPQTIQGLRALVIILSGVSAAEVSSKVAPLVEVLSHECSVAIPVASAETSANCTTATGTWDHQAPTPATFDYTAGNRGTSTNIAKLVNLLEFIDYAPQDRTQAINDLTTVLTGTTDIYKLAHLTDNVTNSSDVVGLVNAVMNAANAGPTDLSSLLNAINLDDVPKLTQIVTDVTGATEASVTVTTPSAIHDDVGVLLGTYDGSPAGIPTGVSTGVGYQHMATLIRHVTGTTEAGRLASVLNGLNVNLTYNAGAISRREGLVRLLLVSQYGSAQTFVPNLYTPPATDIDFPAVGPYHLSILMNNASTATSLITLMNGVNIMDAIVTIGCVDHVGDYTAPLGTHDGDDITVSTINTPNPNFETPCTALPGSGW